MTQDDYILGRSIGDSVRVDTQHLLWETYKDDELHPELTVIENMKIAKPEKGTAQLPPTVELYGFDIFDDPFPSKEPWPRNIKLSLLSSLSDSHVLVMSTGGNSISFHRCMLASNLRDSENLLTMA
ncbi:hypothetical protein N7494_010746 [Penicillium frequentans]|uniref:Uncharacterized protein n=1 Tax=Penicillium frequentans TaxID=3151616 RepID=A0AAD6CIF9_9EURO|nr:hypothetical protein N7494_010746 [Penicillium glabrum]